MQEAIEVDAAAPFQSLVHLLARLVSFWPCLAFGFVQIQGTLADLHTSKFQVLAEF